MKLPSLFRKRVETVSKAEHESVVAWHIDNTQAWRERVRSVKDKLDSKMLLVTDLTRELEQERDTVARLAARVRELKQERNDLRIQAEANAADALLWRTARAKRRRKPEQKVA